MLALKIKYCSVATQGVPVIPWKLPAARGERDLYLYSIGSGHDRTQDLTVLVQSVAPCASGCCPIKKPHDSPPCLDEAWLEITTVNRLEE